MNLITLQSLPQDRVRALFGLEPAALGELLAAVLPPLLEKRYASQQAKKGRKHAVVGQMFSVSADISENSFHEVILLLREVCPAHRFDAEKKWTKKEPSWHPDPLDLILVDSFETPLGRSSLPDVQKKFYFA